MRTEQLKHLPFFKSMNVDALAKLAESSILKHFNKKELLFHHGDVIEYCYIVSSGWIKLYRDTLDGQEALIGLATVKDILGEISSETEFHSYSAKTISDVELLLIPYKILKQTIEANPDLSFRIIKALNANISLLELQLEHASTMNAAQKVACFFLRLTDIEHPSFKIALPYDKNLIAAYLSIKSETFSRALNELRLLGVSINGNILTVKDTQKLINFCCVSCSLVFDSCKR